MIKALLFSAVFSLPVFSDGFEANAAPVNQCLNGKQLDLGDGQPLIRLTGTVCQTAEGNGTIYAPCVKVSGTNTCARVAPPLPPTPVCKPLPAGFTVVEKPWATLMGAPYPKSPSWLQPIGSWTERTASSPGGKPAAGKVYTASFVADNGLHKINWFGAQAVPAAGYGNPQVATEVYVAISPCRGDVEAACSNRAKSSSLFYGKTANVPACALTPGQKYYVNVGFFPRNLDPKTNTCSPLNSSKGVRCDANFKSN